MAVLESSRKLEYLRKCGGGGYRDYGGTRPLVLTGVDELTARGDSCTRSAIAPLLLCSAMGGAINFSMILHSSRFSFEGVSCLC